MSQVFPFPRPDPGNEPPLLAQGDAALFLFRGLGRVETGLAVCQFCNSILF